MFFFKRTQGKSRRASRWAWIVSRSRIRSRRTQRHTYWERRWTSCADPGTGQSCGTPSAWSTASSSGTTRPRARRPARRCRGSPRGGPTRFATLISTGAFPGFLMVGTIPLGTGRTSRVFLTPHQRSSVYRYLSTWSQLLRCGSIRHPDSDTLDR